MSGSAGDGYLDLTLDGDREEYYTPGEYYDLLDYVLEVRNGTLIRTDYDQEQYPFWSLIVSVWTLTGDPSNPLGPQISVTTRFDSGRTDVSETIFSNGPGSEILGHRVSHYDPSGRLVEHDVLDLSGTGTTYVLNEARQVEYQYTKALSTYGHGNWVQVATDFDLDNTQPWSRFTIQYVERRDSDPLPSRSEMLMDDGTSIVYDATFTNGVSGPLYPAAGRWTTFDAQGRVDYVYEALAYPVVGAALSQSLDYDVATGHLDYVIRTYSDRQEAVDYNAGTGFADFAVTSFNDGRTTVLDYEGTTGRLAYRLETNSSGQYVATSYDLASGAADYVIQSNLDGRQVSTDYDVANTQDWASFSLSYKLTGVPNRPTEPIPNVTILYDDGRKYVFEQDYRPAPLSVPGESRSMLFNPQGVLEYATIRDGAGNRQEVDYDGSSGQIDYLVSHWADGRMTATDYDLADQFAWNSYTVIYDAFGNVQSVTTT